LLNYVLKTHRDRRHDCANQKNDIRESRMSYPGSAKGLAVNPGALPKARDEFTGPNPGSIEHEVSGRRGQLIDLQTI
jgi:hypothetical protein